MRISRHQTFMQVAEVFSRRSTCFRRNVGAVLVKDNNIVSHGYNGPDHGEPHCTGNGCAHPDRGCIRSIHAEENALERVPMKVTGPFTMYVTESPCASCASSIISNGLEAVYFLHQYRLDEGCKLLVKHQIPLFRMTPSGMIIDWKTGQFIEEM